MKGAYVVYRKELYRLFASPIFYVVAFIFLALAGYFFYSAVAFYSLLSFQASRDPFLSDQLNLSDMVLIKDNHLKIVGSIREAIERARDRVGRNMKIEVETTTLEEVKEAVKAGADMIMLDNMTPEEMSEVVGWVAGRVLLEASGNITLSTLGEVAASGVDFVSVGGLTHYYRSLDISMEFL